jgi:hypothetical protein
MESLGSIPKLEEDDVVVANETLVITPVPSLQGQVVEKVSGAPTIDNAGPPDGGYGWVVVMYVL